MKDSQEIQMMPDLIFRAAEHIHFLLKSMRGICVWVLFLMKTRPNLILLTLKLITGLSSVQA